MVKLEELKIQLCFYSRFLIIVRLETMDVFGSRLRIVWLEDLADRPVGSFLCWQSRQWIRTAGPSQWPCCWRCGGWWWWW